MKTNDPSNSKRTHPASRPSKRRSCDGKRRYGRAQAEAVARMLRQRRGDDVYAYPCLYCRRLWHVGHAVPEREGVQ